ncbi:MAG TPA: endonuclease MutS2 [Candidatus Butyricicoccus avistercoris]|uniref:Endonuclease MutS2 n=1 Tax=Candidatus Butyricicoccus avistercoris TaxID=2838518 RepID=A0A9D1PID0_9FIRM|nr:endonuclease MutS2 [Candidatus Butyricicoccus avistercoris]
MNRLAEKSLKTLEYYAVLELLAGEAASSQGKNQCMALRPVTDLEQAEIYMKQTSDAKNIMTIKGSPSLGGIREITGALKRAEMGGVLNLKELLNVASVLQCVRLMQTYFSDEEKKTSITPIYRLLAGNQSLEQRITTSILSEEEVADGASSELTTIRRQMRQISGKVRDVLSKLISGERSKYLQETIITQRNGRYVVPVKAEHRGDVAGLVHDTSSSGATVFVEPAAVVEINNQMKILEGKEQAEIERILSELSAEVSGCAEIIRQDLEQLITLDFIFARAKLSFKMNATSPNFKKDGYGVTLKRARHPLLDIKKAVPIDIAIGTDYDTLVITGPNTGGKTVSLKTLGLLSLMAASGLHIPANELSEVCVFENVYADIGDEQSIEQSLSTFSSHMKTIVGMMEKCAKGDLVLFDELGAGTDPVEGAALAVSVIGYARQMGAFVAATTHYSELKTFALTTDGVENASCEFDVGTLRPTYRLLTGIPGKSNAFAIAARLGLQPVILERAKEQLSSENTRFEDVLAQLEKERRLLEKYKAEAERLRSAAQSERDKAENLRDKSEDEADRIVENARLKADRILKDARMTAETVFAELDDIKKKSSKNKEQNLAAAKAALRGVITQTETELRKKKEKRTVENTTAIHKGDEVQLINVSNIVAVVLTEPDNNGNMQVQAGIMKTSVNINEVRPIKKQNAQKPKMPRPSAGGATRELKLNAAASEVDVRGMCAEEAIIEVDQFLSSAMMSSLPSVRIIHGKGTGVLRNAIQQHLKRNKRIKTVRNGVYGEGENGVTVVEFK